MNAQTVPNYTSIETAPGGVLGDRDLWRADDDHWFFQCDLKGADGWTVAAYAAMLGDPTMLDDYRAGLKPYNILCVKLRGYPANFKDRDDLREWCKKIEKESWDAFASKRVQHGACITGDHEVLTREGWLRVDKISNFTDILVYEQGTTNTWFERPKKWTREPFEGELCSFEGTAISLLCTPNHRILLEDNGLKVRTAEECLTKKSGRVPYVGNYIAGTTTIPARFAAALHADGCFSSDRRQFQFHFKKERKIERLKKILNGVPFKEYNCADGTTQFSIPISTYLNSVGIRPGKQMLEWTRECMSDYIDEVKYWDGTTDGINVVFNQVNFDYLTWVRTIAHLCGKGTVYQGKQISGFGSPVHRMSLNNREFAWLNSTERKKEKARTVVYCPTVSTGFFFIKRNEKISVTGNSYLEGDITISRNIIKDSEGKLWMPPSDCGLLKTFYFERYFGIPRWHRWVADRLRERPFLTAASGQVRQFFGRPDEILTKAVAFEPQANTTYATNLAMSKLWRDPENRRTIINHERYHYKSAEASRHGLLQFGCLAPLRIEPLHQVHDALCGQFLKSDTSWAVDRIKSYFNNTLLIASQQITIPFDGGYGPSWGELGEKYGGGAI